MPKKRPDKAILAAEVVSPVALQLNKFLEYMPNPDLLLSDTGETLEIYRRMLLDARISSLLDIRKSYVLTYPWQIQPGDETPRAQDVADFVSQAVKRLNLSQALQELLSAEEFGFALEQVVWDLNGGQYLPKALVSHKPERFVFEPDGTPILIAPTGKKVLDEPYKFIVYRHNPGAENPYGNSVLRQCYWPWMFKKAGFRFWLTAAEKFGVPTVLALFDTDDEAKAQERAKILAQALAGIQSDAAVALANVKQVDTLEIKGDLAGFKVLIEACNAEISFAITGQSLATGEGEYDARAAAEVHEGILGGLARGDATQLAYTLSNTLVAWVAELNFGADAPKPVFAFDLTEYASIENVFAAIDRKIPVSKNELYGRYHLPRPINEEDTFIGPDTAPPINMADDSPSPRPSPPGGEGEKGKKKLKLLNIYNRR